MTRAASVPPSRGDLLSLKPYSSGQTAIEAGTRQFLLEVRDDDASKVLVASLPLLERLLLEKSVEVRERRLEEIVDFMAEQLLVAGPADVEMAQRLAERHARVLNEFGYFTSEELADANRSQAANRSALADNWRKRRQVFAVPHPDKTAREKDIYPAFQFEDYRPIKAVQGVLEAFGEGKAPWKLALWFTSNNGWLPDGARPVDLLKSNPKAVVEAATRDAEGSAA